MLNTDKLTHQIREVYGILFEATDSVVNEGYLITLKPFDIEHTISFSIGILIGWRSLEATFIPAAYAAELVGEMGNASADKKAVFVAFVNNIVGNNADFLMRINDTEYCPKLIDDWPQNWAQLQIKMRKDSLVLEKNDPSSEDIIMIWSMRFIGAIMSLLPTKKADDFNVQVEEEGMQYNATTSHYERSAINRAICIEMHGFSCKVCGFSFEAKYGEIGKSYIHVHHIEPLSSMPEAKVIDPVRDLVPVCPNCHSMLHKKCPPYTIEELRKILR